MVWKYCPKCRRWKRCLWGGGPITDAGLEHLKGLSKLDFLRLWGDRFTGSGLVPSKKPPRTPGVQPGIVA